MQRCYALLVGICRIELAAVEQLLDGTDFSQTGQLHNILLDRKAGLLIGHIVELMLAGAVDGRSHVLWACIRGAHAGWSRLVVRRRILRYVHGERVVYETGERRLVAAQTSGLAALKS
jgi:hypothetical protein